MDVHIGEIETEVRPVDDRGLLSPEVLARVVEAVLAELQTRRAAEARAADETRLWGSVRAGRER